MSGRRIKLRVSPATAIVAGALVALAAWPVYLGARASASAPPVAVLTPAPVKPDWKVRDANIAFLESRAGKIRGDMLTPRMLSGEYFQRYRERGDLGDVLRAEHAARLSLAAMPHRNVAGDAALAGALLTLHRFREAKAAILDARRTEPDNAGLAAEEAGLDLELGDVEGARRLDRRAAAAIPRSTWSPRGSTKRPAGSPTARTLVDSAMRRADAIYDTPAERRAWYPRARRGARFRSGRSRRRAPRRRRRDLRSSPATCAR